MPLVKGNSKGYLRTVEFQQQGDDGLETISYKARFKRLSADERAALGARFSADAGEGGDGEPVLRITVDELLDEVMIGWADVVDEHGAPVEYSAAERADFFNRYVGMRPATEKAWWDSITEGAAKN